MEPELCPECKRSVEEKCEALSRKRLKIDCNDEKNKTEDYEESSPYRKVNNDGKNKKYDEEHEEAKRDEELETEKAEKEYGESSSYRMVNNDKNIKKYDTETEDDKKDNEVKETEKTEEDEEAGISEEKNRNEEESFFLKLYTSTFRTVKSMKDVQDSSIHEAIDHITNCHKGFNQSAIDFKNWDNICGFLYRYAAHGAGFARFRILNALRNCKELKLAVDKNKLRVICLGSGPGNDAVGFCSSLAELHYPDDLVITAVDKFIEWSECIDVVKDILKKQDMGKVSELFHSKDVFSFIQVDLPGDPDADKEYFLALAKADIIIISKLLSSLGKPRRRRSFTQSLYKNMKKGALILLNDIFFDDQWNGFKTLYSWGSKEEPYQSTAMVGWSPEFCSSDNTISKLPITVLTKIEN